jgi:twinkle protein
MDLQDVVRNAAAIHPPGQIRLVCPSCGPTRKPQHQKLQTLSIKRESGTAVYHCHHCGIEGRVRIDGADQYHDKFKPKAASQIGGMFGAAAERFLRARRIDVKLALDYGVRVDERYIREVGETACLCFPYVHDGTTYAWKFRALAEKGFSCEGAPATFFGADKVVEGGDVIITEGELDALALATAGIRNAVSVPNGAVMKVTDRGTIDPREDGKFKFVWHGTAMLKSAKRVLIATDGDGPGQAMAEELARRIGRAHCWRINWPDGTKDANDVLIKLGATKLLECINAAVPWPVAGLYRADHYRDRVVDLYVSGAPQAISTGYRELDQLYKVVPGQLTVVTGTPSHGKSQFLDNVMINIATTQGWRFAVCSFENPPVFHIPKLLTLAAGQPFFAADGGERMSRASLDRWYDWIGEHFDFIEQADGSSATIDSVLERATAAVQRNGIRGLVIDPYNYLDRPGDDNETRYVSDMLTKVRNFATAHDCHVWFVAHPTKLQRVEGKHPIPKGWDISGSFSWFSKADNGLTIHRPEDGGSEVHVWKIRWNWVGRHGIAKLDYDHLLGKYTDEKW